MVIATFIVLRIALLIIKSIVIPVEKVHSALVGFSEGKLDIPVDYESTSELGEMCDALRSSQHTLASASCWRRWAAAISTAAPKWRSCMWAS